MTNVSEQTAKALKQAIFDLGELGEVDATTERALRRTRYTVDQVLGDWFPEGASRPASAKEP